MLQPSDEELMGYDSVSDDDDLDDEEDVLDEEEDFDEDDMGEPKSKPKDRRRGASAGSEDSDEEEGIGAWGKSKKDLYNADQIETEADALEEEQEAKRLQKKHLQAMNEADFGFDETEWVETGKEQKDAGKDATEVTEVLPQVEVTEDMSEEEKLKILKSRYPEFEPLSKDFIDLQPTHRELEQTAKAVEEANPDDDLEVTSVPVVKFRALSAYLGTISMYFMLLASPQDGSEDLSPLPPAKLRSHPVMGALVKFRKIWESVRDLSGAEPSEDEESQEISEPEQPEPVKPKKTEKKTSRETQEQKQPKKLSKAQRAAEAAQAEAEARRAERLRETEANLAGLSNLTTETSKKRKTPKSKTSAKNADDSDFGDEDALTAREAEEKAKQKRSLRFYTSQLAQKANKRNAAGRDAGGDTDLPYRERMKDREARLNAEAEKRGKQQPAKSEQLGGDSEEEDYQVADRLRNDDKSGTDDDEYYDMVAARNKQRKDDKKARADAHAEAARVGGQVDVQEEIGPDGKRAITYQIEKNKGLTPKRNKDSRNPRVKKRKRFEDKKKKLGSIRQQYKGGEGRGGYGGELTGIKKNVVKSVKL